MGSGDRIALVPVETWAFSSPSLKKNGLDANLGLLADALVNYERVFINLSTPIELCQIVQWFARSGALPELEDLVKHKEIRFYYYDFVSTAVLKAGEYSLWNVQDSAHQDPTSAFERKVLGHRDVRSALGHTRRAVRFHRSALDGLVEVKADDFGPAIDDARVDSKSSAVNQVLMQALLDEIYPLMGLSQTFPVTVDIREQNEGKHQLTYNLDFDGISRAMGSKVGFYAGSPLIGLTMSNRLLRSASRLRCDLCLPNPMAGIVSNKLVAGLMHADKVTKIVDELITEVDYPDVRTLVNAGTLDAATVLTLRKKAGRFRHWLHSEAEIDRNALVAYLHESAEESGITKGGRRLLHIFGILASGAVGAVIGQTLAGPIGGAAGALAGEATKFMLDMIADLNADWKPKVFGSWARQVVAKKGT